MFGFQLRWTLRRLPRGANLPHTEEAPAEMSGSRGFQRKQGVGAHGVVGGKWGRTGGSGEKCDCVAKGAGEGEGGVNLLDKSSERASVNRY